MILRRGVAAPMKTDTKTTRAPLNLSGKNPAWHIPTSAHEAVTMAGVSEGSRSILGFLVSSMKSFIMHT